MAETNLMTIVSADAAAIETDAAEADATETATVDAGATAMGSAEARVTTAMEVATHATQAQRSVGASADADPRAPTADAPSNHPTGTPVPPWQRVVQPRTVILREGAQETGAVSHVRAPAESPRSVTPYDVQLRQAFSAADANGTGGLSKRQLYGALEALGLKITPSEELALWQSYDRDRNGRVDFSEFHRLGAALLEAARAPTDEGHGQLRGKGGTDRVGFARGRSFKTSAFVGQALTRIRELARQRSMEDLLARLRRDGKLDV